MVQDRAHAEPWLSHVIEQFPPPSTPLHLLCCPCSAPCLVSQSWQSSVLTAWKQHPCLHSTALLKLPLPPAGVVQERERSTRTIFRNHMPWVPRILNTLCRHFVRDPLNTHVFIRLSAPFPWLMCPYGGRRSLSPLLRPQG